MRLEFHAPPSMLPHCNRVFHGEYAIPLSPQSEVTVLDIGANCGAFSLWAASSWPKALVLAYEPAQRNFEFLLSNTKGQERISCHRFAVTPNKRTTLFHGRNNCGEHSFFRGEDQTSVSEEVHFVHPKDLPRADILKLDTEGCELEILRTLVEECQRSFRFIMLEYHSDYDRRRIDELLGSYELIGALATRPNRGVLKYSKEQQ